MKVLPHFRPATKHQDWYAAAATAGPMPVKEDKTCQLYQRFVDNFIGLAQ